MKGMKLAAFLAAPLLLLFASSCAVPKFEGTFTSTHRALLRGEIKEALAFYETQAQEAEKNAATSWFPQQYWGAAVRAYLEAARAARLSGQLQKSIAYGEKALEIVHRTQAPVFNRVDPTVLDYPPYPELSAIYILIPIYRSVRNFDRARVLIEKGLTLAKEIPPLVVRRYDSESILYTELGRVLLDRREYEKAIDAFLQAVYLRKSYTAGSRGFRWTVEYSEDVLTGLLIDLGNAYRLAGRLQDALEQYEEAFKYVKIGGTRTTSELNLYRGLGEIYLEQKNFPQALDNFNKALAFAESQQRPDAISSVGVRMGDILRQTGKPAEAIPHYQKAVQQIESIRSLLQSEEYRQSYFEGGLDVYVSVIDVLLSVGKQEEGFNYSERARSRVFLDVLGSKVQLSRAKSGLLEEERALNEKIAGLKATLAVVQGEEERAALNRDLGRAEQAFTEFLAKVRKENKEQVSLMAVEPLTLKEVQELLDPGSTLIEYFVTRGEIFIWVVEKEKVQFVRALLPREKLAGLVKELRETIFTLREKEKFNEASGSLYQHLIQPLLPHITGKELIIIPHDVLHYLPFHTLLSPKGRYLIEDFPIYYLSSASLLQFTKEKRKAKGEKVLALGNPDLGDPSMNLRFAETEAREIAKLYSQSTVLLKREATEEKSKALSPQHDIIHFASHAELSEEDPLSSAILLAKEGKEDGRLEVREIFEMNLNANLVVLSACETGLGKLSSGDELVGLTRAFIYAGTPSVMASLWKVEDSSTAALMASFYKNLRTMTKVEALREAQLQLIRGEGSSDLLARRGVGGIGKLGEVPQTKSLSSESVTASVSTSHPYFWAPFILVGDGK